MAAPHGRILAGRRLQSETAVEAAGEGAAEGDGSDANDAVGLNVESPADDAEFDVVEAALQEVHDIATAMRQAMDLRMSTTLTPKAGIKTGQVFLQLADDLDKLLSPEVIRALFKSARQSAKAPDTLMPKQRGGDVLEEYRRKLTADVARFHRHAPFELTNSRSHNPEYMIRFVRAERDADTVRMLEHFTSIMPHGFNAKVRSNIADRLDALVQ